VFSWSSFYVRRRWDGFQYLSVCCLALLPEDPTPVALAQY
jgi:hypothetical protein